jgi:cysteine desulfurase
VTRLAAPAEKPLYLDHPATTPPAEEVIEAMLPWLRTAHANPHADNLHGQRAAAALEQARSEVASLIGADPSEIVFTSGATEANNLALRGFWPRSGAKGVLAVSAIEHKSVLETARDVASGGVSVCMLPADPSGRVAPEAIDPLRSHTAATILVSCAHANNELGTVQDLARLAAAVQNIGGRFHVDASQSAGKIPMDASALGLDLVSVSSHKLYGPAGIGALFVAADLRGRMRPLLTGGGQEGGLRSGTVPVFLAVGFGRAAALAVARQDNDARHLRLVAAAFLAQLHDAGVEHRVLTPADGLPGLISLAMPGVEAADLLDRLAPELSASTGSACAAGELRASHVLRAIGLEEAQARQVLRLGFGRTNTAQQARDVARLLATTVKRMRMQV